MFDASVICCFWVVLIRKFGCGFWVNLDCVWCCGFAGFVVWFFV